MDSENTNTSNGFFSLSPVEYTSLAFALAMTLANGLDDNQRVILGNFFIAVGDTLVNLTSGQWTNR